MTRNLLLHVINCSWYSGTPMLITFDSHFVLGTLCIAIKRNSPRHVGIHWAVTKLKVIAKLPIHMNSYNISAVKNYRVICLCSFFSTVFSTLDGLFSSFFPTPGINELFQHFRCIRSRLKKQKRQKRTAGKQWIVDDSMKKKRLWVTWNEYHNIEATTNSWNKNRRNFNQFPFYIAFLFLLCCANWFLSDSMTERFSKLMSFDVGGRVLLCLQTHKTSCMANCILFRKLVGHQKRTKGMGA